MEPNNYIYCKECKKHIINEIGHKVNIETIDMKWYYYCCSDCINEKKKYLDKLKKFLGYRKISYKEIEIIPKASTEFFIS